MEPWQKFRIRGGGGGDFSGQFKDERMCVSKGCPTPVKGDKVHMKPGGA